MSARLVFLLFLLASACADVVDAPLPTVSRPAAPAAALGCARVGRAGGWIIAPDESAELAVPTGALPEDQVVCLERAVTGEIVIRAAVERFGAPPVLAVVSGPTSRTPRALALAAVDDGTPVILAASGGTDEGTVLGLVDRPGTYAVVSRRCEAGTGRCPDDGHGLERCVLDVDRPGTDACAIPCDLEADCPAPLACVHGMCALGACTHPARCDGRCVGEGRARACLRGGSQALDCSDDEECEPGQVCWAPGRPVSASQPGRCTAADSGCVESTQSCAVRAVSAVTGFLPAEPPRAPVAWVYGARALVERGDPVTRFGHFDDLGGADAWVVAGGPGNFAGQVQRGRSESETFSTRSLTVVNDHGRTSRFEPVVTVLRWIVPRQGRYAIRVEHDPIPDDERRRYAMVLLHEPADRNLLPEVLARGGHEPPFPPDPLPLVERTLAADDRVELSLECLTANRGRAFVRWTITRLDDLR